MASEWMQEIFKSTQDPHELVRRLNILSEAAIALIATQLYNQIVNGKDLMKMLDGVKEDIVKEVQFMSDSDSIQMVTVPGKGPAQ